MEKSLYCLKQEFLFEMKFISNIGSKVFVCPFIGRSRRSLFCYYITYSLVVFTAMQLFVTLCLTRFQDWFEIINIAPNLGVCLMIIIKYSKIHTHKNVYNDVFVHFRNDLWDVIEDCIDHRRILNEYTSTTRMIIRFTFYYTILLAVILNIFPRIIMLYESNFLGKDVQYLYPFDGWYPFDKIKWYYTAYIWESFMTTVVIFIYVFANMIHISFTRYLCMELKILSNIMEKLVTTKDVSNIMNRRNVKQTHENVKMKLKVIIKRHQFLAKTTSDLNEILGDAMLLTYVFGSVFICLTAFTATVVDDFFKTMRYFSFFCSLLIETFVQCIIGQLLIDHSAKLEKAIYFTDWPYLDTDTKNMLLIILLRTQKPLIFTAKGYLVMNLDTFSGICSLSYQFFNLLHTVYN